MSVLYPRTAEWFASASWAPAPSAGGRHRSWLFARRVLKMVVGRLVELIVAPTRPRSLQKKIWVAPGGTQKSSKKVLGGPGGYPGVFKKFWVAAIFKRDQTLLDHATPAPIADILPIIQAIYAELDDDQEHFTLA